MSGRRAARIQVSPRALALFLGLPDGALIDCVSHDMERDMVVIVIEGHQSLPYVVEGDLPPMTDIEYEGGRFKRFTV